MDFMSAHEAVGSIAANIGKVMQGQSGSIKMLVSAFVAGGHVLLEDVPGTGKTTLAKAFSKSVDMDFQRIQFTPDLLPSDILGVNIYDQKTGRFSLYKGPVFTDILLADEINRASPRTQSALLEAMAEKQISLERDLHHLSDSFFVMATQNAIESHGTYPLPEAQMDRFFVKFGLGYVDHDSEVKILSDQIFTHPIDSLSAVVSLDEIADLRKVVHTVRVSDEIKSYIVDIVAATRSTEGILMGASPRASLALMKMSQAYALFDGLDYITPDIIQNLVVPTIAHRVVIDPQEVFSGNNADNILRKMVEKIPAPV